MKTSNTLFREECGLPRLLTWSLVLIGAGAIAWAGGAGLSNAQQKLLLAIVIGTTPWVLLLFESLRSVIEVDDAEVRFSFTPFYRRRFAIGDIHQLKVTTYHPLNNPENLRYGYRSMWVAPTHCVELAMHDGSIFTLVSDHPERLSAAIGKAKTMAAGTAS